MSDRRVIIISGAGGCIGQAICKRFLDNDDNVIAIDNNQSILDEMAKTESNKLLLRYGDATNEDQVKEIVYDIAKEYGVISVLINNVGGNKTTLLQETTSVEWLADIELNLNSAYYFSSSVLSQMKNQGHGIIVNIGSVNGLHIYGDPGYSAAKAGLINFTKFVATEYGNKGIRCNIVCPGTVKTKAWNAMLAKRPDFYEEVKQFYSSNEICYPEDVAGPVFFLCSDDAKAINGSTIVVDGGLTAGVPLIMKKFSNNG